MCVNANGHIFATLGLLAHIGFHLSDCFAGLHPDEKAMSEKRPRVRGHKVSLVDFMVDRAMTEFKGATKYIK